LRNSGLSLPGGLPRDQRFKIEFSICGRCAVQKKKSVF
jgi:hypothetical protein